MHTAIRGNGMYSIITNIDVDIKISLRVIIGARGHTSHISIYANVCLTIIIYWEKISVFNAMNLYEFSN